MRRQFGCAAQSRYKSAASGRVSFSITFLPSPRASKCAMSCACKIASASAFCGEWMSTSGSIIGVRPRAKIAWPTSNCCSTTAAMPPASARLIIERILVPKMPCASARSSNASRPGLGFINCTPPASSARPLSTFKIGMMRLSSHKYLALGLPPMTPSMVCSNKIAARIESPVNASLVMMRARMAWTLANISASPAYASSAMPYNSRALGVLPPLWSRAAMKPGAWPAFSNCAVESDMGLVKGGEWRGKEGETVARRQPATATATASVTGVAGVAAKTQSPLSRRFSPPRGRSASRRSNRRTRRASRRTPPRG